MKMLKFKDFVLSLNEAAMLPTAWNEPKRKAKYRPKFLEFLEDPNIYLMIDDDKKDLYSFSKFLVSDISNLDYIKSYIESDKEVSGKEPLMDVKGVKVPLTHLLKTGLFTGHSKTSTDTDTKEGMVAFFYYNQDADILSMDPSEAVSLVDNIPSGDLYPKTANKLKTWLSNFDKANRDQILQWKSTANVMTDFASSGYRLDRNEIFNMIRSKSLKLSSLSSADNWCPGDVYLIDQSAKSSIINYVNNATTIGELNLLFSTEFSPRSSSAEPIGSIVAISLKQEAARLGRAKEYLKSLSPKDAIYNLTPEEISRYKKDIPWVKSEILKYQQLIGGLNSGSYMEIHYNPGSVDNIKEQNLGDKLAAIKLVYHLFTLPNGDTSNLDNNLIGILKFGLKQSDKNVNPPYHKITGKIKSKGTHEFFHGGDTISMIGSNDNTAKVVILDSFSRLDLVIFYYVTIADIAYEIRLRSATTNSKQAGLEFEAKDSIGNIVEDPERIKSITDQIFNKRSAMKYAKFKSI
jgi:hypothetical protein